MRIRRLRHSLAPLLLLAVAAAINFRTEACSPKAVKSVFIGREAAQLKHNKMKMKYRAGKIKPLGQKLGLSRGGEIMEDIGVDRLRKEIKYLKRVEATIKRTKKDEIRLAKAMTKAQIKGKPLKGWAKKAQQAAESRALIQATEKKAAAEHAAKMASEAASKVKLTGKEAKKAAKLAEKTSKAAKKTKGAPAGVPNVIPPPVAAPPAAALAAPVAEAAKKKRRFIG